MADSSSTEMDAVSLPTDPKERKRIPLYSGLVRYFPRALIEVAKTSQAGNDQHHPGSPLHWDRTKSTDELDALLRHLFDDVLGVPMDGDVPHLAKVAWRALAHLEKACEASENIPNPVHELVPFAERERAANMNLALLSAHPEPGPVVPVSSGIEERRIPPPELDE